MLLVFVLLVMLIIGIFGLTLLAIFTFLNNRNQTRKKKYESVKETITNRSIFEKVNVLNQIVTPTGFAYDPNQDIFYSVMNGWQKGFGYCRLYDECAASMYMIIHCEPIYFEYKGRRWLIEFWKGQYGMTTGGEVGVYVADGMNLNIQGVFDATIYKSPSEEDYLPISITLWKNDNLVLRRSGWHWWLTGFVVGEFSNPSELTMEIEIIMRDKEMRTAFLDSLEKVGYTSEEVEIRNNSIKINFDKPHTKQPTTQKSWIAKVKQRRNKKNCKLYQNMTKEYNTTMDRIEFLRYKAPKMFTRVIHIGKTKQLFEQSAPAKKGKRK